MRKHQDWFDENREDTIKLLEEKRSAQKAHLDDLKSTAKCDKLKNIRSKIQLKLWDLQDTWLSRKADEIQSAADRNDMKSFYSGLKEVYDLFLKCCYRMNASCLRVVTLGWLGWGRSAVLSSPKPAS